MRISYAPLSIGGLPRSVTTISAHGESAVLNLDLTHPFLANAIKAFNPLRIRVGGSLQDQVVYGMPNLGHSCVPFSKTAGGLFGFSQGCLSMKRWDEINDLFLKTGIRVGGSLQDQVVYGMPNLGHSCVPFSKTAGGLFGFSQGCLSMKRWDELNDLFLKTGNALLRMVDVAVAVASKLRARVAPDADTYALLIAGSCCCGDFADAAKLWNAAAAARIEPGADAHDPMILAMLKSNRFEDAVVMLKSMRARRPRDVGLDSYRMVITWLCKRGRHPDCHIILDHPSTSRFHLEIRTKPLASKARRQRSILRLHPMFRGTRWRHYRH